MMARSTRSKYRVGQEVELMSTSVRKTTVGTITAASVHRFTVENHAEVIVDTLYRVEVAHWQFGKATRFVFESGVRRALPALGKAA